MSTTTPSSSSPAQTTYNYAVVPPIIILIIVTCTANVLVIVCVRWEKKLQKVNNLYVVSLAVADCVVGLPVMTGMLLHSYYGYWPYGQAACIIWMSIDFPCCTISMLHLCLIGYDRYNAIVHPLVHRAGQMSRRAKIYIVIAWLIGILAWVPAIIPIRIIGGDVPSCLFNPPRLYILLQSIIVYYTPIIAMIYFYIRCLKALYVRNKHVVGAALDTGKTEKTGNREDKRKKGEPNEGPSNSDFSKNHKNREDKLMTVSTVAAESEISKDSGEQLVNSICASCARLEAQRPNCNQCLITANVDKTLKTVGHERDAGVDETGSDITGKDGIILKPQAQAQQEKQDGGRRKISVAPAEKVTSIAEEKAASKRKQHQRCVRTLGAAIIAFLLCWLPVCVVWPISGYCEGCVPDWLYEITYWTAYLNSSLNPMLYFICNRDFRAALIKLCKAVFKCK